jgi:hypothetical protein
LVLEVGEGTVVLGASLAKQLYIMPVTTTPARPTKGRQSKLQLLR